jgi:O-antigen/teichoic acid export membrane protein
MTLRQEVYRGGGYLAARQAAGLVLSVGGVLLLTRLLGPATYGMYAAALTLQLFAQTLAGWGVGTYLIRYEGDERIERYHHASSFLVVAGIAVVVLLALALPLAERWSRLAGLSVPALLLFAAIPLQLLTSVPMARIERALAFRVVARVEMAGQFTFFAASVSLALAGAGVWAPVAGFWLQQLVHAAGYFSGAHYRPEWSWSKSANRAMLNFGGGYSVSLWLWQARRLANPLIIGRYLGSEGVAWVAVATQIVTQLSTLSAVTWRLSVAVLSRVQTDAERTGRSISEGMQLQALVVGPPLVAFGWLGGWLVPLLFGADWTPLMRIYSAIAIGFLTNALFQLHSSALYVRKRTADMSAFHAVHVLLLAGTAALLVPRLGLIGYAWAEIAALLSYAVLHWRTRRVVTHLSYGAPAAAWAAFALALALPNNPWAGALLITLVLALPSTRTVLSGLWQHARRHVYGA